MTTVVNFAHPLTGEQQVEVSALIGGPVERVLDVPTQLDSAMPFGPQVERLLSDVPLRGDEWQTLPLIINLPSLSIIAALLLAHLHGLCGYFPAVLRLRPIPESVPPRFEVAEVLNLQGMRDSARSRR